MNITRLTAVATATIVLTLLAGCAPGSPAPASSEPPPASPAPTETGAPAPGERPAARTEATCDDLVAPGAFDHLFTAPLALVDATRTGERMGTIVVDEWFVRQAGGLACEWQSADSLVTSEGRYDYQGVQLLLIPATDAQWAPFAAVEVPGGTRFTACGSSPECRLEAHSDNGWWLSLWGFSVVGDIPGGPAVEAFDRVMSDVAALAAPAPAAPISSRLGTDCTAILTPAQAAASIGESAPAIVEVRTFVSLGSTARDAIGGSECFWSTSDWVTPVATVTVLPGGAWAMAEAVAAYGGAEAVELAGSDSGGWFRPQVEANGFDFAIDGTWVNISASDRSEEGDSRGVILSIAAAIIANAG